MDENAVAYDDKQAHEAFSSGYAADSPPVKTGTDVAKPDPKPVTKPVEAPAVAETPKFAQITQEELDDLRSAAKKTATIEGQMSKVFGTVGNFKQVIERLQSQTPGGITVELTDDDFAELAQDYPELAGHTRKSLERIFKKVGGAGQANREAAPDPDAVQKLVNAASIRREEEALEDAHPTWRDIVGAHGDANNDFRKWLATQPEEYQTKINATNSATIIARSIDRFLGTKTAPEPATPAPKMAARADRIRGAIQPKGDGGMPAAPDTSDDEFHKGYATG